MKASIYQLAYVVVYSLSIILINPWGDDRGEIWTMPKIFMVILATLLNGLILGQVHWQSNAKIQNQTSNKFSDQSIEQFSNQFSDQLAKQNSNFSLELSKSISPGSSFILTRSWWLQASLWALFLTASLYTAYASPFSRRAFFGQSELGDGWLYWVLIALFFLSNQLVLQVKPQLFKAQIQGLILGGVILAIACIPQLINWKIDYTETSGFLYDKTILYSSIFKDHQPIGFYSHRGHNSFVLTFTGILGILAHQRGWFQLIGLKSVWQNYTWYFKHLLFVIILILARTRMTLVATLSALIYLFGRRYGKLLIIGLIVCFVSVGITTSNRTIAGLPVIKQITSDRVFLWETAIRGIQAKPLFGWGFDGFGLAFPTSHNPEWQPPRVLKILRSSFRFRTRKGEVKELSLPSNRAHNLILDTWLSVGLIGLSLYAALCTIAIIQLRQTLPGFEVLAIVYLLFTVTWFECAQYTHLFWWVLSLGAGLNMPQKYGSEFSPNHPQSDL